MPHLPTSTDIWAAGVTLYCLAYGHLPFQQPNFIQLYQDILTKPYVSPPFFLSFTNRQKVYRIRIR